MTELQVLIVAYGRKGIESIAGLAHPMVDGVEYIVSWQTAGDRTDVPRTLAARPDFRIFPSDTRGVARNRNLALDAASAPLVVLSDDDVSYTEERLRSVIRAFKEHPQADYISFRYHSSHNPLPQHDREADLRRPPKGWGIGGAFTMAFRLDPIRRHGIRFNELFGIGAEFPSGEEDLFLHDILRAGLTAIFLPIDIVTHENDTTAMRTHSSDTFIRTKGAVFSILFPLSWSARMLLHARRFSPLARERRRYIRAWLSGRRDLRKILKTYKNSK